MSQKITIGRHQNCDLVLDDTFQYASSLHADIILEGDQFVFVDHSRNGTLINRKLIHGQSVPINYGDSIVIASRYPLSWNQIHGFFPQFNYRQAQYRTYWLDKQEKERQQHVQPKPIVLPDCKWNWGAFSLYPVWGVFNGCWWAFLIWLLFWWSLVPNILFGVYGTEWSWANKLWTSAVLFNREQERWNQWGIYACIVLLCLMLMISLVFGVPSAPLFTFFLSLSE